jgi:hypothetical protein
MRAGAILAIAAAQAAVILPATARADDYFGRTATEKMTFRIDKERTSGEWIFIASLGGGAVAASGVGLLFTLDSRRKSNRISAIGRHTGQVYTSEVESTRRAALRSRTVAIVGFSVGGALLAGATVAFIATDPGSEVIDLEEYQRRFDQGQGQGQGAFVPVVDPQPGGAVLGASWAF